jgi:hypothetical protein
MQQPGRGFTDPRGGYSNPRGGYPGDPGRGRRPGVF